MNEGAVRLALFDVLSTVAALNAGHAHETRTPGP
jgi:hypothetical protein